MFLKRAVGSSLYVFVVVLVWFLSSVLVDSAWILPDPWAVLTRLGSLLTNAASLQAMAYTLLRLIVAIGTSFLLGGAFGVWAGVSKTVAFLTQPIASVFRTIPVVSIIVVVLLMFGFRAAPYAITFLMLMPIAYQAAKEGVASIDAELIDVYRLEDDHPFRMAFHCYLPLMSGYLRTALLQSAGLGVKVMVMAEYLAQTPVSIGAELSLARTNIEIDVVFAWTVLLIVVSLFFERLIRLSQKWLEASKLAQNKKSPAE